MRGIRAFEYSILNVERLREKGMIALESSLNRFGKDGWELVAIDGNRFIFKREKPQ